MTSTRRLLCSLSILALAACSPPANPTPDASDNDSSVAMESGAPDASAEMDGATETDASASEGGTTSEDWGFRPMTHGFAFENYSNMSMPMNLTAVEMRRLFGPQACEGAAASGACRLVPAAQQWMEQKNNSMNGGHCEGMAVLASMLYSGALSPASFGMGATSASQLVLAGNDALTREVALWFSTQYTLPTLERRNLTPSQVIDELSRELSRGRAFGGTVIGIYLRAGGGGHAITPYAIRRPNATTAEVLSYDNNWPNIERVLTVNLATNTWRYEASTNPMEPSSVYDGDATTFNLTLADIAPRGVLPHACAFCGEAPMDGGGTGAVQVSLRGAADLAIADSMGRVTGHNAAGDEVNNIPGAGLQRARSASLFNDSPEPEYTVPRNGPLTITLDGARLRGAEPSDVLVTGPGYSLGVEGVTIDPMQADTITLQPGAPDFVYRTTSTETPTLVLAFQRPGADYTIELRSSGMTAGQALRMSVDYAMQRVRVSFDGSASSPTFAFYMDRETETEEINFTSMPINATPSTVLYFNYGTWSGNGMPVSLSVDTNGDGTIDRTDSLADQS